MTAQILSVYLPAINLFAFFIYGLDKYNVKHRKRRISERFLILTALLGGSLGALTGMYLFRHKTRHRKFTIGVPLIFALQLIVVFLIRTM